MAALTILDMHRLLDQEIQSMGYLTYRGSESEEIDLQINTQIDNFVEAIVDKYKSKQARNGVKEGFQANQVRLDDLRTIHIKDLVRSSTPYGSDGVSFPLPDDYSHHIKTKVTWSIDCIGEDKKKTTLTGLSQIRIAETEDIENMRVHPFYKTTKESPLAELVNNTVYVYTDGFTITEVKIDYIKKPAVVKFGKDVGGNYDSGTSVNCDLPHTVHRTIIRNTAIHISSIIESNPQKIENLKSEVIN